MIQVLTPLAKKAGLSFAAFGEDVSVAKDAVGTLKLAEAYHSS